MAISILVVEQDPETTAFLKTLLLAQGFDVHTAANASQGIDMADRMDFDLIICDALLPDEGSVKLCRNITCIPVLYISAIPLKSLFFRQKLFARTGENGQTNPPFLEKPLQEDELLDHIGVLIHDTRKQ